MDTNNPGYQNILSDNEIFHRWFKEDDTELKENEADDLTEGENWSFQFKFWSFWWVGFDV